MTDKEKVIKGITHHKLGQCDMSGKLCPYWGKSADCMEKMLGDALAIVKEQEQAMKEKDGTISNLIAQIKEISQCYERVVRCKDCEYKEWVGDSENIIYCHKMKLRTSIDWFCADAKRR